MTKLVHGEEEAEKAKTASDALFAGGSDDSNMPSTEISADKLTDGAIGILDLMDLYFLSGFRHPIMSLQQDIVLKCTHRQKNIQMERTMKIIIPNGVFADDIKVESIDVKFTAEQLKNGIKIRKGKKAECLGSI